MKQIAGIIAVIIVIAIGCTGCATDGTPNHIQQMLTETAEREYEYGHRSGTPSTGVQNGLSPADDLRHQQGCEWAKPQVEAEANRYLNDGTLTRAETQQAIRNALNRNGCN